MLLEPGARSNWPSLECHQPLVLDSSLRAGSSANSSINFLVQVGTRDSCCARVSENRLQKNCRSTIVEISRAHPCLSEYLGPGSPDFSPETTGDKKLPLVDTGRG